MEILDTQYKRKSFAITSVIMVLIVLIMLFAGMSYMDPPPQNGVLITFGNSNVGRGVTLQQPLENKKPVLEEKQTKTEELLTQDTEETVSVAKVNKKKKTEKTKPSEQTTDALKNILKASKKDNLGKGDDNLPGNKGSENGNPYSNSYYGSGGDGTSGSSKGWGLNGRSLKGGKNIAQECNQEGRVVVQIEVDRQGNVVGINAGVKGTTNMAKCLIEAAEKTAKTYKWNADKNAPDRQIGFIVINFKLGE